MSLRDRFEDILSAANDREVPPRCVVPTTTEPAVAPPPAPPPANTVGAVVPDSTLGSLFGSKLVVLCLLLLVLVLGYCVYSHVRRPDEPDPPTLDELPEMLDGEEADDDELRADSDDDLADPPEAAAAATTPRAHRKPAPPAPPVSKDPMFQLLQMHQHEPA